MKRILLVVAGVMLSVLVGCGGGDPAPKLANASPSTSAAVTAIAPQNGWWWNPAEGGRGFAIEVQGNQIFMASFLYEVNGAATWYVSTMTAQPNGTYYGPMTRYFGGQTLLGTYKSPASTTEVANASLNFSSSTNGVLTVTYSDGSPSRNIVLQRFPISSPVAFANSNAGFQSGWWWNQNEGGRGYFIEVQGSQAFIGSFMYDSSGQPTWYVSTAALTGIGQLGGALDQYVGGQSLNGGYRSPTAFPGGAGTLSFSFQGQNYGVMTLPNGKTVSLSRFGFNPDAKIYSVGGRVTGLAGTGLVLQNNGTNNLSVFADGVGNFTNLLATGASYSVTVLSQPTGQYCAVSNGTGTIGTSNISNVSVVCTNLISQLSCPERFGQGTDGVSLYTPNNQFTYKLSGTSAYGLDLVTVGWGAANSGQYYSYTGSLAATLWAVSSSYSGGYISGNILGNFVPNFTGPGAYSSRQIWGYNYSTNTIVSSSASYNPAPGQYCLVLTLEQYLPGQCTPNPNGYCIVDWLQFGGPVTFR